MFEERNAKLKKTTPAATVDPKLSLGAKLEAQSRAAQEDLADALFAAEITTDSQSLRSEKDYTHFAKQVGNVLYEGRTPYNIPAFFSELIKGLGKEQELLKAEDLKKIVDTMTVVYNAKVADDKKKDP